MNCLCGAEPVIEIKTVDTGYGDRELYKYKCPNCEEKELPWLGQWEDTGALQEWERIAGEKTYHKRTLEYNEHGVCLSSPVEIYKWKNKKGHDSVTVEFFLDNYVYYYRFDFWRDGGCTIPLSISDDCYKTLEAAKQNASLKIIKIKKGLEKIVKALLLQPVQSELFLEKEE